MRSWPISRYHDIHLEDAEKKHVNSHRVVGISAEIRSRYLPNVSQNLYLLGQVAR